MTEPRDPEPEPRREDVTVALRAVVGGALERRSELFGQLFGALRALAVRSERQARLVELRFFRGLAPPEAAEVLDSSLSTVEREWRVARACFLHRLEAG